MQYPFYFPDYSRTRFYALAMLIMVYFLHISTISGNTNIFLPQSDHLPVEINYSYPDQVEAGTTFSFTISLKKDMNYKVPGMISCRFVGGFSPENAPIEAAEYSIEGTSVFIKWQELSNSNIIIFSLPVSTSNLLQGVYPVKINYSDEIGVNVSDNVGIFVFNKSEIPAPEVGNPHEKSPYTIGLKYPEEVLIGAEYPLEIHIAKGKNTGPASIFVQVPPASKLDIDGYEDFHYDEGTGSLTIKLQNMPPGPEFKIVCSLISNTAIKAVYPLKASVEFQDNTKIFFHDFILVTDQLNTNIYGQDEKSNDRIVKTSDSELDKSAQIFQELNELLDTWKKSTSSDTQIINLPADQNPSTQAVDTTKKIIFYSVQVIASAVEMVKAEDELRKAGINERLLEDFDGQIYRYSVGVFENIEAAEELKVKLANVGYPDAFVVKYEDGVRTKSYY